MESYAGKDYTQKLQAYLVDDMADELYEYNRAKCGSVYLPDFTRQDARELAKKELLNRMEIDLDGKESIEPESMLDYIRWDELMA